MTGRHERTTVAGSVARVFLCLLFVSVPVVRGEEAPPDWTIDNFRWAGALAPSTALEVLNPYGDIRLRPADAGETEVSLSAMIQRRISDPVKPDVKIGRRRGRLTIEVAYPVAPQGDLHRVDIAVFVPAGAKLAARTREGMIQANALDNDVELESAGGNVSLTTTGTARIVSDRGDISANLKGDHWNRAPRLFTRKGDITLRLPAKADARLQIRAPGEISLREDVRVERRTDRETVVTFGRGTRTLFIQTQLGSVALLGPAP